MLIETSVDKCYGIMLSGGIDSAVLFYLLIRSNPAINLQPFTIAKADGAALYAGPVIDHMNRKFGLSIPSTILVGNPTVYHRLQSTTAVKEIFDQYPVDHLYIGINTNPPELADHPSAPIRSKRSLDPRIIFPFVDLYKDRILEIMYAEGQEDLIDITHTCTEQQYGRCGVCWQCQERIWAFRQLNKTDTGVL